MRLLARVLEFAFECQHRQLSRVFTIQKRTYQVCFECGKELEYSWESMHSVNYKKADESYLALHRSEKTQARAA